MLAIGLFFYIARRFLFFFLLVALGVGICLFLVDMVELLRKSASVEDFNFAFLLKMAGLHFPFLFEQTLPFTVLLATVATYATLTGNNELIALRASGISVWQFTAPSAAVALALGFAAITLLNPLAVLSNERFKELELKHLEKGNVLSPLTGEGLWVKEGDEENYTIVHVGRFLPRRNRLAGVKLFFFTDGEYYARVDAGAAFIRQDGWEMKSAWLTPVGGQPLARGNYFYGTDLSVDKIRENLTSPEQVHLWQYAQFIAGLRRAGLDTKAHAMQYGSLLARPLFLTAMLLLGMIFSLRATRRGHRVLFIAAGILVGSTFYIFVEFFHRLGVSGAIPVGLAVITPIFVGAIASCLALAQIEDG